MIRQLIPPSFTPEDYSVGLRSSGESHGVVMTKPHIVSLILDMTGYLSSTRLDRKTLLEPSCGKGAFVIEAAQRLLDSAKKHCVNPLELRGAIFATDLDGIHVKETKENLKAALRTLDLPQGTVDILVDSWVVESDFLLHDFEERAFDFIVGNPP